jgi:hypothetical protein
MESKKELNPVEEHLLAAHHYFSENKFQKAKEEIYMGYLLDPLNELLSQLEEKIRLMEQ